MGVLIQQIEDCPVGRFESGAPVISISSAAFGKPSRLVFCAAVKLFFGPFGSPIIDSKLVAKQQP
jgi:hypothetical protein